MKVKKFKKQIDAISEFIANPATIELGMSEEDAEKYVKVLEIAKDLAKENKKLKKEMELLLIVDVEELKSQVAEKDEPDSEEDFEY